MISLDQYKYQLSDLARVLSKCVNHDHVQIINDISNQSLSVNLHKTEKLSTELNLYYDKIYQVPSMKFRIWEHDFEDSDISSSKLLIVPDSELRSIVNIGCFTVTLSSDPNTKQLWYHINNCDTDLNIGTEPDSYLLRMVSVYMHIFDPELNITPI